MGKLTSFLGLFIPERTDKGSVVTNVFEPNFKKLDDNAKEIDTTLTEIKKNGLYQVYGIKRTEGEEDIYDCTLEGIENFEFETINMLLIPDKSSSKANVFIRLAGTKYQIISNIGNSSEVFANQGTGLILKKSTSQAIKWDMSVPVIDNLITSDSKKALSANQGKILKDEVDKIASKEQLGRIKIGKNLIIKEDGTLDGQDVDLTGYYTKPEIDEKLKNFCPFPVGSVLPMWNETNPTSIYLGTTWELLTADKYIRTGNTPLSTGGSNAVTIDKANLPNVKLKIDSFQLGKGTQEITGNVGGTVNSNIGISGAFIDVGQAGGVAGGPFAVKDVKFQASKTWTGTSTPASPNTEALGTGTPLSVQPSYITLKFWKRLT